MGKPAIQFPATSDERHLTVEDDVWLCGNQAISDAERVVLLAGLLSGCVGCRGGLKQLAAPSEGSIFAGELDVVRVLVRALVLYRDERGHELAEELRAAARVAIERGALEPTAIARLLLEVARQLACDRPGEGVAAIEQARVCLDRALDRLATSGRGELALDSEQHGDLQALADAYLAHARTQLGQLVEARRIFERLARRTEPVTDPEIRATILEQRAEMVRREGRPHRALYLFEQVRRLLEPGARSPAEEERLCETLLYLGIVLIEIGRGKRARKVLQDGCSRLRGRYFPRLARELRFYLGTAELACEDLARARRHLESPELVDEPLPARMEGHRLRMLGEIERREGGAAAEERLEEALRIFVAEGAMENAARVLLDLLALTADQEEPAEVLWKHARTVIEVARSEAACHLVAGELRYRLNQLDPEKDSMTEVWRLVEMLESPAGVVN